MVEDNDKDDNNYKDISALGLDRPLGVGKDIKPNKTKPNSRIFGQTRSNSCKLAERSEAKKLSVAKQKSE